MRNWGSVSWNNLDVVNMMWSGEEPYLSLSDFKAQYSFSRAGQLHLHGSSILLVKCDHCLCGRWDGDCLSLTVLTHGTVQSNHLELTKPHPNPGNSLSQFSVVVKACHSVAVCFQAVPESGGEWLLLGLVVLLLWLGTGQRKTRGT